jgi:uncharacterized membrane protein
MQETTAVRDLEQRLTRLERRFEETSIVLFDEIRGRETDPTGPRAQLEPLGRTPLASATHAEAALAPRRRHAEQTVSRPAAPQPSPGPHAPAGATPATGDRSAVWLADLVGGRVLAWIGGAATLTGIVLFLALAISHGWIDREARVALAAAASCGLMAGGIWLHARKGRTEASAALVGTATAGLFATLLVASQVYELIPAALALAAALLVGALATSLAIRWAGVAVGALGLVGGLMSPVLVGAPMSATTIAALALAGGCATAVIIRMRWAWLGLVSVLICAPQWASYVLAGQAVGIDIAVLGFFAALGMAAAAATKREEGEEHLHAASAAVAVLSAAILAVVGRIAFKEASGSTAAEAWLVALAGIHALAGCWRARSPFLAEPMRRLLIVIGVVLADVAFALVAGGITVACGWAGASIACAWSLRRVAAGSDDERMMGAGVGAHVALTLTRAVIDAPTSASGAAAGQLVPLLSLALLAASCLGSAQLIGARREHWAAALNVLGLGAIAYLTAVSLTGSGLVCAWSLEAFALARIARANQDNVARYGAFAFLILAGAHVLVAEAPPTALLRGVGSLGSAAIALGVIAVVSFRMASLQPSADPGRRWLFGSAATALLYLASVAIVTVFQPAAGTTAETVVDLSVQQQGQMLLSVLWCLVGVAALLVGLNRRQPALRSVALGWLLLTVGKVFLYDLATLTSIYRVISFIVLGLLLLAGAFAYQRLRPPPPPDMRAVHPSQL